MLENSDAKAVIVEDDEQLAKITEIRDRVPKLEHVIRMEGTGGGAISMDELIERGAGHSDSEWEQRWQLGRPRRHLHLHLHVGDDRPAEGLRHLPRQLPLDGRRWRSTRASSSARTTTYLFLPLAHSFALLIQFLSFDLGGNIAYWERDPLKIVPNLVRGEAELLPVGAADLREDLHRRDRGRREGGRPEEGRLQLGDPRRPEGPRARARRQADRLAAQEAVRDRRQAGALEDPRPLRRRASRTASPAPRRSTPRSCASSTPPGC